MKLMTVLLVLLVTGCAQFEHIDTTGKQGILVEPSHQALQTFLYLTEGATFSLENAEDEVVPWKSQKLIELGPGEYNFSMWFNWSS